MTKRYRFSRLPVLGAVLAAASVSGCFLNPDSMPPNETVSSHQLYHSLMRLQPTVVEPQVETITMIHRVDFAFGSHDLGTAELDRIAAFLADSGADRRARIELDGPRKDGGYHDVLTAARLQAIADGIARLGVTAAVAERPTESLALPSDAMVVTVTRAMVIEPDCDVPKTIYGPRPTHIWSCSTAVALGRMVVDPLDIERGRTLGPGDGEALALGQQRYRTDKVKKLKTEATVSSDE